MDDPNSKIRFLILDDELTRLDFILLRLDKIRNTSFL